MEAEGKPDLQVNPSTKPPGRRWKGTSVQDNQGRGGTRLSLALASTPTLTLTLIRRRGTASSPRSLFANSFVSRVLVGMRIRRSGGGFMRAPWVG
jgi:hypothetical protein